MYRMKQTGKVGQTLTHTPQGAIFEKDGIYDIYDAEGHLIQVDTNYGQMTIRALGLNHIIESEDGSYVVVRDI